jgi:hypothetical protein
MKAEFSSEAILLVHAATFLQRLFRLGTAPIPFRNIERLSPVAVWAISSAVSGNGDQCTMPKTPVMIMIAWQRRAILQVKLRQSERSALGSFFVSYRRYLFRGLKSLMRTKDSMFLKIFSLLVSLGNFRRHACSTAVFRYRAAKHVEADATGGVLVSWR